MCAEGIVPGGRPFMIGCRFSFRISKDSCRKEELVAGMLAGGCTVTSVSGQSEMPATGCANDLHCNISLSQLRLLAVHLRWP